MKKELKDYLHFYLGCEMYLPSSESQMLNGKLVGIHKKFPFDIWQIEMPDGAIIDTEEGFWNDDFGHTKPLLRPLADMNEEEIKEVAWKLHRFKPAVIRGKDSVGNIKIVNHTPFYYWINVRQHLNAETCAYLLKQEFDLFEFIESGLAIDKSQLNTDKK